VKKILSLVLVSVALTSGVAYAQEPANLSLLKQKVKRYHDSGNYDKDIANVMQKAMRYLELRIKRQDFKGKPAIVLDIDETSLSNYPDMVRLDFGGTIEEIRADEDKGMDEAIAPTIKLYRFAKDNKIAVFFLTGRFEEERATTEENLKKAGYTNFDGLILRDGELRNAPAAVYKTARRKALEAKGYDIIISIGDQQSDLRGGFADKTFKLPNPYYFIP
jgi:predicted secreted acid phosphatase